MKNFNPLFSALLFCSLLLSCGQDEPDPTPGNNQPVNSFQINSNSYETPNAYLVFNTVSQYDLETMMDLTKIKDQFNFIFTDGIAIVDEDGDLYYSTDTEQVSNNHFRDVTNGEVKDDINQISIGTGVYEMSPSTTTVYNANIVSEFSENGLNYGELDGYTLPLTNEDETSFNIQSINIDYENMKGMIECTYSVSPSSEGPISGQYSGGFDILVK